MANYSDIFPLNVGGSSIAGFNWTEKTADFTAVANEAYYCDTALGDILMTLPSNPSPGDEVAFLILGANAVNITTTDNIKSAPLGTDFVKQVTENYLMVVLFYVDGTTGWDWDVRYDGFIGDLYTGIGFLYFRIDFTELLSEIAFYYADAPDTMVILNTADVLSFARDAGLSLAPTLQYNNAVLNDGNFATGYTGTTGNQNTWVIHTATPHVVSALHLGGQSANYNRPTLVKLWTSPDGVNWTLNKEWVGTPTLTIANSTGTKFLV